MENKAELSRLEQFIDTLLTRFNDLKKRYHDLQKTLEERDAECAALKEEIAALQNERTEVGGQVARLIERIETWEEEQAVPESAETGIPESDEQGGIQAQLFHPDRESMS